MQEIFDSMDELIIAFLKGKITQSEKEKLEQWIASDIRNKDYFKTFYKIWNTLDAIEKGREKEERLLEMIKSRIEDKPGAVKSKNIPLRRTILAFSRWAAAVIISFGLGALLFSNLGKQPQSALHSVKSNGITIPLGSKSYVDLPDGTTVILNAGSRLTYNTNYGLETREVDLVGEGYFKVAKDKRRPFIVHTGKVDVRALGTEFNVKAYPDEDVVETILVSGSVVVDEYPVKGKENTHIVLKPGQKIRLHTALAKTETNQVVAGDNNTHLKQINPIKSSLLEADPVVETSWKDERWIIKSQNMEELSVLFSRRFNIEIVIEDHELADYKFSGTIRNETVEQVFEIIRLTIPLSFTIDEGRAVWSINRNLEKEYQKAYKHD